MGNKWGIAWLIGLCACLGTVGQAAIPTEYAADGISIVAPDMRSADIMSRAGIHSNEVLLASYMALAAYETEWGGLAERTLLRAGWTIRHHRTDMVRFITANKETSEGSMYVLAVSGTEKKVDIRQSLRDRLVAVRGNLKNKVHSGYREIVESIRQTEGYQTVRNAQERGQRVLFTGHSLGGAVAILLGTDFMTIPPEMMTQTHIITFAAPDMANPEGLGKLPDYRAVNYIMKADIIPGIFHFLHGGYGRNPQNIHWDTHSQAGGLPHSMVMFLDEAFYQAALTFNGSTISSGAGEVYIATAPVEDQMNMNPLLRQAYLNAVVRMSGSHLSCSVYRDYVPSERQEAIEKARRHGSRYLLWTPVRVISQKQSEERKYALEIQPQWYDVASGRLLHWSAFMFSNRGYTVFPWLAEYVSIGAWSPPKAAS